MGDQDARQLLKWEASFNGARPLLDDTDSALNFRDVFAGGRNFESWFGGEGFDLRSQ